MLLPNYWMVAFATVTLCNLIAVNAQQTDSKESVRDDEIDDNDDQCKVSDITPVVTNTLRIGRNNTAWVIDHSISSCSAKLWLSSLEISGSRKGFIFNHMNYTKAQHPSGWNYGSPPWSKAIATEQFAATKSWKNLSDVAKTILQREVELISGNTELLRVLDVMPPSVKSDCMPGQFTLSIFLNDMWNLNNYGQVSFYDVQDTESNQSRWEISATVHPHPYRAILWPSCHPVLFRAPCINHFFHLKILNLKLSTNLDAKPVPPTKWYIKDNVEEKFAHFAFTNSSPVTDFSKHLVRTFNDGNPKRQVYIFDSLFARDELIEWRNHLLRFHPGYGSFDPDPLEDHDNVQWVGIFSVEAFLQTAMWPRLESLCEFVSNHTDWHPYDVALNYVRSGDHTRIHSDSEMHQDELTMVLYLNEDLTPSDFGETTFYVQKPNDEVHSFIGEGGEVYEAIGTVAPKFGRVVIFTNNIEHSAHPPSSQFAGSRYTFALKVSRSRRLALIKMAYEKMEWLEMDEKMKKLKKALETGSLDNEEKISTEKLASLFENIRKKAEQRMVNEERAMIGRMDLM